VVNARDTVRAMPEQLPDPLLVDRRPDGIAVLTLNDPDRRNAMSDGMTAAWTAAIARLRADSGLRCVVVTGAGSAFTSGGDLSWLVPALRDRMLAF
jgi:enoyl-CoA hydratase